MLLSVSIDGNTRLDIEVAFDVRIRDVDVKSTYAHFVPLQSLPGVISRGQFPNICFALQ